LSFTPQRLERSLPAAAPAAAAGLLFFHFNFTNFGLGRPGRLARCQNGERLAQSAELLIASHEFPFPLTGERFGYCGTTFEFGYSGSEPGEFYDIVRRRRGRRFRLAWCVYSEPGGG
jgi:hypothetical protein